MNFWPRNEAEAFELDSPRGFTSTSGVGRVSDAGASASLRLGIIIPARNEERSVGTVIRRCLSATADLAHTRLCVVDNGSSDGTAAVSAQSGAEVVYEEKPGYGRACLLGIAHLGSWPEVLLFLDADGSSRPEEIPLLLEPWLAGKADLVIGRRPSNSPMTLPQKWGTRLAAQLVALRWGRRFADIGPFRAIGLEAYNRLGMEDQTWGWTVEMQILALKRGLKVLEVPVSWEKRLAGTSKISGTVSGVLRAGGRILWTIARHW